MTSEVVVTVELLRVVLQGLVVQATYGTAFGTSARIRSFISLSSSDFHARFEELRANVKPEDGPALEECRLYLSIIDRLLGGKTPTAIAEELDVYRDTHGVH